MAAHGPVIGILYPGEMGAALGKLLVGLGQRVITTLEGRSERTRQLCEAAGLPTVSSLADVVAQANVVLSLVTPGSAVALAERYRSLVISAARDALFVDVNSVSPESARTIAGLFAGGGVDFVDAAIHGLASQLRERGTLYLSGARAAKVASLFGESLRVKIVGGEPGQASAFKMLLGGMSKGLVALFLEMGQTAHAAGLLTATLEEYRHFYPGIMDAIDRLVPTYPRHASRRGEEMRELEATMRGLGLSPTVIRAAREVIEAIGRLDLATTAARDKWQAAEVIREIADGIQRLSVDP